MVSCNLWEVKVTGSKGLIKAELATLIYGLRHNKVLTDEEIKEVVDKGLNEDLDKVANDIPDELVDKLNKIINILEG